ncbi:MAG: hypothetical protein ACLFVB_07990 [Thermoplasmata archaeon]
MSEKTKVRLMVIPIVAMLAVTMVVVGWQQGEEQVEIEIEEELGELTIEHLAMDDQPAVLGDEVNTTGSAIVNNESHLELKADPIKIEPGGEAERIYIHLTAEGTFEEELDVDTFKFTGSEMVNNEPPFNGIQFETISSQIVGGEIWPSDEQRGGVRAASPEHYAYQGYDLESNEFVVENVLYWSFPEENVGEESSLEIQAVVHGLSEDVTATVQVNIEGGK